jgi:tetratricopeptide (TPR) repeat protein
VAVPKKKKNRPAKESASTALDEIESRSGDLAEWISANPLPILAVAGAILAIAAIYTLGSSGIDSAKHEASTAIAVAKGEYRNAMGGSYSGTLDVPEPANPEIARSTRLEYIERFQGLAAEQAGSEMGSYAWVQAGSLQVDQGDLEGALESFQQALEPYDKREAMRGIILERIAVIHEQLGDLPSAAAAHLEASEITSYPLRYFALLNAARNQAEAGQTDAAIVSFERVTKESPDLLIPEHTQAMLMELQAARAL